MKLQIVSVVFLAFFMSLGIANATVPAGCNVLDASNGVLLSTLKNNPLTDCIISGDKEFWNFGFQQSGTTVAANQIKVYTIGDGSANNLFGIEFGGNIGLNNIGGTSPATGDVRLFYYVATTGGQLISDIHQHIVGSDTAPAGGNPNDFVNVGEVATDDSNGGNTTQSNLHITDTGSTNDLNDPPAESNDLLIFGTPVKQADVAKDIALSAGAGIDVNVTIIEQRFSQVPEPRDMALLLSLGLGILLWRKRTSARA